MASPVTDEQAAERAIEKRFASRLLDVLIRAGIVLAAAMLCYRVFAPFLTLTIWALILAVTLYALPPAFARSILSFRIARRRLKSAWGAAANASLVDGGPDLP